jgi:4-hydroxy-3-polyprenylbenzoate decarboxylase
MRKVIIGISGASGVIYGIRFLEILKNIPDIETHLVISKYASITIAQETEYSLQSIQELADFSYHYMDLSASIASGSFKTDCMIIAPCSMKTLGSIANGIEENLLTRSASVILKERKPCILMARETPLHLAHIINMKKVTQMGGIIAPPVPAFYARPTCIEDIVDHSVVRVLDIVNIEGTEIKRWK